jgi:peptidoglycan/xylan/chitin deacetylase (PgdA/CDA1 family)
LQKQVGWLQDAGVSFVTALELCEAVFDRKDGPAMERLVALTFDDGYADFYTLAWPCLKRLGVRAVTVFICPDHVGESNAWNFRAKTGLRHMDLNTLRHLRDEGVQLEPHGREHRNFLQLTPDRLAAELDYCQAWFNEQLGLLPRLLAYPFGDYRDDQLPAIAARFSYAFAMAQGRGLRDRHAVSRRNVSNETTRETLLRYCKDG